MSLKYQICLTVLFVISNLLEIEGRCGYPALPFMSASIQTKDFYEEGETLKITCIGSVVIGQTMNDGVIECKNNTWNTTSLRCTQVQNITAVDISINGKQEENPNLKKQEFIYLSDNNPMTCVSLRDEEQWVLHLDSPKYVSNVAIIATFVNDRSSNDSTNITVSLSTKEMCQIEETTNRPESPIVFLIYKCPNNILTENVSVHLQANGNDINICDIDIFAIIDECGKPELPLYSFANQMKIQNGTKIVEYVCAKGYTMSGSALRTCGSDGLWHPLEPPICLPEVKCNQLSRVNQSFVFEYNELDLFGNAMPDISQLTYHCLNVTDIISEHTVRYCQNNGNWSPIRRLPVCHPRSHVIVVFGKHLTKDKHLIFYGGFGLVLLFAGSAIILFHMRRLAKRISRQMRENAYLQQEKVLPNYNNESNYHDIAALFSNDANTNTNSTTTPAQSNEPKF